MSLSSTSGSSVLSVSSVSGSIGLSTSSAVGSVWSSLPVGSVSPDLSVDTGGSIVLPLVRFSGGELSVLFVSSDASGSVVSLSSVHLLYLLAL